MSTSVIHADEIDSLIADLASDQGTTRQDARRVLVAIGGSAAAALIQALQDHGWRVRWRATQTQ